MSEKYRKLGIAGGLVLAALATQPALADGDSVGAVYTMSNAAEGNTILVFDRDLFGKLTPASEFDTGGLGTGAGLGNQGALILDPSNRWLFVVNAGSNDISVFAVDESGLTQVEQVPSGGQNPISLTYSRNLLYVLNAGGAVGDADSITGFAVGTDGSLTPIPGSTRPLSDVNVGPAQVSFNADGDLLVVTEKATNLIDTFTVDSSGVAGPANVHVSAGTTPFGFAIGKRDQLIVSEAAGGAPGQSSLSSYLLGKDGSLTVVSPVVPTTETAACWAVVSADGRFTYTTNAGSGSISGYGISFDGSLMLLDANGRTGNTGKGSGPLDMAFSNDGRYLYTLNGGNGTIGAFRVKNKGGLALLNSHTSVPASANGLAVR